MNGLAPVPAWDGAVESLAALQQEAQVAVMNRGFFVSFVVCVLAAATPALAADGFTIPEPSTLALLAMGTAGLIIGRRAAKRPPEE